VFRQGPIIAYLFMPFFQPIIWSTVTKRAQGLSYWRLFFKVGNRQSRRLTTHLILVTPIFEMNVRNLSSTKLYSRHATSPYLSDSTRKSNAFNQSICHLTITNIDIQSREIQAREYHDIESDCQFRSSFNQSYSMGPTIGDTP
jgi:hypothetical protein